MLAFLVLFVAWFLPLPESLLAHGGTATIQAFLEEENVLGVLEVVVVNLELP